MSDRPVLASSLYFSHRQFFVFDKSVALPGCAWTDVHFRQGFARRQNNVCFGTLMDFGEGQLSVYLGPYSSAGRHNRIIAVPIELLSGEVVIAGPEEFEDVRVLRLTPGHYRLTAAQVAIDEESERIDLYFETLGEPISRSQIIVADEELAPLTPLLETVEVA